MTTAVKVYVCRVEVGMGLGRQLPVRLRYRSLILVLCQPIAGLHIPYSDEIQVYQNPFPSSGVKSRRSKPSRIKQRQRRQAWRKNKQNREGEAQPRPALPRKLEVNGSSISGRISGDDEDSSPSVQNQSADPAPCREARSSLQPFG